VGLFVAVTIDDRLNLQPVGWTGECRQFLLQHAVGLSLFVASSQGLQKVSHLLLHRAEYRGIVSLMVAVPEQPLCSIWIDYAPWSEGFVAILVVPFDASTSEPGRRNLAGRRGV